jgi:hypothetical protein
MILANFPATCLENQGKVTHANVEYEPDSFLTWGRGGFLCTMLTCMFGRMLMDFCIFNALQAD